MAPSAINITKSLVSYYSICQSSTFHKVMSHVLLPIQECQTDNRIRSSFFINPFASQP